MKPNMHLAEDIETPLGMRAELVSTMLKNGVLTKDSVTRAFAKVPRHLLVPEVEPAAAYTDEPIVIRRDETGRPTSSSTTPKLMARMLELTDVQLGDSVLEVGTGTGYNTALLSELVGPNGLVVSLEYDEALCATARTRLVELDARNVEVVCQDGAKGYPARAPYDAIIITTASFLIAKEWLEQLRPGGRLVVPFRIGPEFEVVCVLVRNTLGVLGRACLATSFTRGAGALGGPIQPEWDGENMVDLSAQLAPWVSEARRLLHSTPVTTRDIPTLPYGWFRGLALSDPRCFSATSQTPGALVSRGIIDPERGGACWVSEGSTPIDGHEQWAMRTMSFRRIISVGNATVTEDLERYLEAPIALEPSELAIEAVPPGVTGILRGDRTWALERPEMCVTVALRGFLATDAPR